MSMSLIATYIDALNWLEQATGASRSILHVHCGLAIYVVVQLLLRERRASITACKIVFAVVLVHECVERLYYGSWRVEDTVADILLTILWPVILTMASLYRRRHWQLAHKGTRLLQQVSAKAPNQSSRV